MTLNTDRKPRRSGNGQTIFEKAPPRRKSQNGGKKSPGKYLYWKIRCTRGTRVERVSPYRPPDCRYYFIILSEERNIHNSLSTRPFSSYMQILGIGREKERSTGKGKKKTTLQEFLILMVGGGQKRRTTEEILFIIPRRTNEELFYFCSVGFVVAFSHFSYQKRCFFFGFIPKKPSVKLWCSFSIQQIYLDNHHFLNQVSNPKISLA